MAIRKSARARSPTPKVLETQNQSANKILGVNDIEPQTKKRKLNIKTEEDNSDKIDPVERLLSLPYVNNDILLNLEEDYESNMSSNLASNPNELNAHLISLNFTKILNDNLTRYYSNFSKSPLEIYNDHSSFAILNKSQSSPNIAPTPSSQPTINEVPFFKNVNFNPKSKSAYAFDDYLSYEEGEDSPNECEESSDESSNPKTPIINSPEIDNKKMSFHYRHNDNLNLSLNNTQNNSHHDIFKIMKKRSILNGKASEMIGTGNFLINDFFL